MSEKLRKIVAIGGGECGRIFSDKDGNSEIDADSVTVAFVPRPGDINGDNKVNSTDLIRLIRYLSDSGTEVNTPVLDVNGDKTVNASDLTHLMKYLSGAKVKLYG